MKHAVAIASCTFGMLVGCGDKDAAKSTEVQSPIEEEYDFFARPPGHVPSTVHPDFQEEGMTKFFVGEWTGGEDFPESFFRYKSNGSCEFQFNGFRYSGAIRYKPCEMTTTFEKDGIEYIVMIQPATEGNLGEKRVDGIAEVFIGFDPEPRVRERALDMTIYKTEGEQDADAKRD